MARQVVRAVEILFFGSEMRTPSEGQKQSPEFVFGRLFFVCHFGDLY